MFNWFFTEETLRALLTTLLGSAAAILSAIIASRNVSKTIKNQNKGLPPELLRLEKIQEIIRKHKVDEIFPNIDIKNFEIEYEKAIHRSTLESQMSNLGIQDDFARKKLLEIPEKITDNFMFPDLNTIHGSKIDRFARYAGIVFVFLGILMITLSVLLLLLIAGYLAVQITAGEGAVINEIINPSLTATSLFIFGIFIIFMGRTLTNRLSALDIETDLIVRNVYQHHSEYFTGKVCTAIENVSELKKRVVFENSKKFRKWREENPGKSSWDYGFNSDEPLDEQRIRDAVPSGYEVIPNKFVFIRNFPFFYSKGKRVVKSRERYDLASDSCDSQI